MDDDGAGAGAADEPCLEEGKEGAGSGVGLEGVQAGAVHVDGEEVEGVVAAHHGGPGFADPLERAVGVVQS